MGIIVENEFVWIFAVKRPDLSDLQDKSIEQHADTVIFIHRPQYCRINEDDEGNSTRGIAEIIIAIRIISKVFHSV